MSKTEAVKIKIAKRFIDECEELRRLGAWKGYKLSQFVGYLLRLGIDEYEKKILPVETMEDHSIHIGSKIIPFGG